MKKVLNISILIIGILLISLILTRLILPVIYSKIAKKPFSREEIRMKLGSPTLDELSTQDKKGVREPDYIQAHSLHPYLGFVGVPGKHPIDDFAKEWMFNEEGFIGHSPIIKKKEK